VASDAKNPRIRAVLPPDPTAGTERASERRRGADRRDPTRPDAYMGVERRQGPRRSGDLPRPLWRRPIAIGLAVALGIAAGLALGSLRRTDSPSAARVVEARVDPQLLASVQALRDEAEALTPAAVALDEQAHELWMPRVAKIELALADPTTPDELRTELDATLSALERVGVLEP
jgi:anti-sigma-K factor RskA